jgi:hypothetical protein
MHDLTNLVAKTLFEHEYSSAWEKACEDDSWLAVGSWMMAEAVVARLPMVVQP